MTPAEQRAAQPLIASAPNVALNTALWRFWRLAWAPVTIACAAIAGAHWAHGQVLNPPGAPRRQT
ncbi:MAG: hypothetical protein JNK99_15605 [Candidatus Accumulibacter sp.]|uniref:hypothetical protein n=1 Tax=Accumulibacter sp. TaxID=2053492 RepID=UPI001A5FB259|nr:hypothetical protein [Accumulibacter sp.]MBL8396145.1 hypothetical protein [Accumulibacter sp.]